MYGRCFCKTLSCEIICDTIQTWGFKENLDSSFQMHRNARAITKRVQQPANEVRVQNVCTLLQRHSTDITYHISFRCPLSSFKVPKSRYVLFCLIKISLLFHKKEDLTWACVSVYMCIHGNAWMCTSISVTRSKQCRHDWVLRSNANKSSVHSLVSVWMVSIYLEHYS